MSFRPAVSAVAVLLAVATALPAIDLSTLKPQGYVSDFAQVVDAVSKAELEAYCARVQKATGVEMAFVTLPTTDGEPIEQFANDLFQRWGIGKKGKDDGLLLLLATRERRSRLEVGRGLEEFITDGTAGSLLREMRPALQANQHGQALLVAAHSLGNRVAQARGVQIPEASPQMQKRPPPQTSMDDIPWPLILFIGFILFWIIGSGGGRGRGRRPGAGGGGFLPGLILGNVLSRGSYGGHGGGFGGYDSGGSFGGFGGGDSGGGGASSDW